MKITKNIIEEYRFEENNNFAEFILKPIDNTGTLIINSSFGTWSYYWGACGMKFKDFLISMQYDRDYLMSKLSSKVFSLDLTISNIQYDIVKSNFTNDIKKTLLNELSVLVKNSSYDGKDFMINYNNYCHKIKYHIYQNDYPSSGADYPNDIKNFYEIFWNEFIIFLMNENKN